MYIVSLFLIYMEVNVYTDFKYLRTKNVWHLLFLIIAIVLGFLEEVSVLNVIGIMLITLIIGLMREKFPLVRMSPGDTKMLVVASMYCLVINPTNNVFTYSLLLHTSTFIVSASLMGMITMMLLLKSWLLCRDVHGEHSMKLGKLKVRIVMKQWRVVETDFRLPAAISILLGVILILTI